MKNYIQIPSGAFLFTKDNSVTISIPDDEGNAAYMKMMQEVSDGDAQIVAYTVDLETHKKIKKNQIDSKTETLVEAGFTHNGTDFKVDTYKQLTAIALMLQRMQAAPMAGKKFRAKDYGYSFADNADFDAFFVTGFARIESLINAGSDLKDLVTDAIDSAAVDAIVDDRT